MESDSESENEQFEYQDTEDIRNTVFLPTSAVEAKQNDLSGIPICAICDRILEDTEPQAQLLCFHKYHTYCFAHVVFHEGRNRCITCNGPIWINEFQTEAEEAILEKKRLRHEKRLETLESEISTNKELLADLKLVLKSIREARKAQRGLSVLGKQTGRTYREETRQLCEILKNMKEKAYKTIYSSPEAKQYRSKRARASFYLHAFQRKYPNQNFEKLRELPKLRIPGRWELNRILYTGRRDWRWRLGIRI